MEGKDVTDETVRACSAEEQDTWEKRSSARAAAVLSIAVLWLLVEEVAVALEDRR